MSTDIRNYTCSSFSIDYATFGDGPRALVILPGMSVTSVLMAAGAVARAFSQFCSTHTVYLIDRKRDIQPGYTVIDMADDTATMLQALGISGADVYGASQGGMIALALAIRHPELVHKLAVASTLSRQNTRSRETMAEWVELSNQDDPVALNRSVFKKVYSPEFFSRNERAFRVIEKSGSQEDMRRFGILSVATADFDVYDRLQEIKCPVSVFGVEDDTVLSGQGSREIADKLGCPYFCYPGKGHAAYDEDPEFTSRLLAFFNA